jgi:hypothetical protein
MRLLNSAPASLVVEIDGYPGLYAMEVTDYDKLGGKPQIDDLPIAVAPYPNGVPYTDGYTIDQNRRFFSELRESGNPS